eukprot:1334644-Amorphochlora_amoeboformis.AAC.1
MDGLSGPRDEKGREDIAQGPNFIIVGAMKAGTESIVKLLLLVFTFDGEVLVEFNFRVVADAACEQLMSNHRNISV